MSCCFIIRGSGFFCAEKIVMWRGRWRLRGRAGVPAFLLHRQAGTARRDDGLAACSPGERFQRFTPCGVSFPARWGDGCRCVATEGGGCALRRAGYRRLRGRAGVPAFLLYRQTRATRRNDGLAACSPGERFQRFTPRGLLRCHGTRGALRVLFFLGVSPPAKKSTQKRSQALLFF